MQRAKSKEEGSLPAEFASSAAPSCIRHLQRLSSSYPIRSSLLKRCLRHDRRHTDTDTD
ncbi:hypothetical protein KTAU_14690 [Thermogemmatispora aurantia]|uniref:Uncharacterized protein n=1 Tax=Thermogemmatispora aurantia TaxID=2045279 RepID=A0A5J4K6Y6_9CHLR|nr:hypothetical protein KTAU_14690 [Thermogemmatispora aurantia]